MKPTSIRPSAEARKPLRQAQWGDRTKRRTATAAILPSTSAVISLHLALLKKVVTTISPDFISPGCIDFADLKNLNQNRFSAQKHDAPASGFVVEQLKIAE